MSDLKRSTPEAPEFTFNVTSDDVVDEERKKSISQQEGHHGAKKYMFGPKS